MSLFIIGGVERIIDQVESYGSYEDISDMTADEIFTNARGDRLYKKELHKVMNKKINEFFGGKDFIELPLINFKNCHEFSGTNFEKAKKLEEYYAEESSKLYL